MSIIEKDIRSAIEKSKFKKDSTSDVEMKSYWDKQMKMYEDALKQYLKQ